MDIIENLKKQSALNATLLPEAPVVKVPLPTSHPFPDIDRQNELEETNTMAHLEAISWVDLKTTLQNTRSGEFPIKVTGDPYAGFAKGPREK